MGSFIFGGTHELYRLRFVIGKALVVVMNGDALAQGFVDLLPEDVVEVRFTAEDVRVQRVQPQRAQLIQPQSGS